MKNPFKEKRLSEMNDAELAKEVKNSKTQTNIFMAMWVLFGALLTFQILANQHLGWYKTLDINMGFTVFVLILFAPIIGLIQTHIIKTEIRFRKLEAKTSQS